MPWPWWNRHRRPNAVVIASSRKNSPASVILTASTFNRSVSVSLRSRNGALPIAKLLQGGGPNACGAGMQHIQRIPDAVEYLKNTLNPKPGGDGLTNLGDLLMAS